MKDHTEDRTKLAAKRAMSNRPKNLQPDQPYPIDQKFPSYSQLWSPSIASPKDVELLKTCYPHERYEYLEKVELRCGSKWRRDHLYKLRSANEVSFEKEFPERYKQWLDIHWDPLTLLEVYFTKNRLVEGVKDVRRLLLLLWAFLPTDWSAEGMSYDLQVQHTICFTDATSLEDRQAIDSMLMSLLDTLCQKDKMAQAKKLQNGLKLFDVSEDVPDEHRLLVSTAQMVKRGGLQLLLKRLLLQTPLLFWPGIFFPEIIHPDLTNELRPCLSTVLDNGIIEVECKNTHHDRGAEVLVLWEMTIEQKKVSQAAVKACGQEAFMACSEES
jgi:hypothetical protein